MDAEGSLVANSSQATVTGSRERDTAPIWEEPGILQMSFWKLLSDPRARRLTLARRLDGDLLAVVTPACRGDRCHPEQVLLSPVQVGYSVEELLRTRLVLAGSLWGGDKATL